VNGEDGLCAHPHPCHLQQGKPHTQHSSIWQSAYKIALHYARGSPSGCGWWCCCEWWGLSVCPPAPTPPATGQTAQSTRQHMADLIQNCTPLWEGEPLVVGDDAVVNGEDSLCVHPHPCHLQQGKPHTQHGSIWQSAYKITLHYARGRPFGCGWWCCCEWWGWSVCPPSPMPPTTGQTPYTTRQHMAVRIQKCCCEWWGWLCIHPYPRHLQQGKPHTKHGSPPTSPEQSVFNLTAPWQSAYNMAQRIFSTVWHNIFMATDNAMEKN
jgi:hypothetical protein